MDVYRNAIAGELKDDFVWSIHRISNIHKEHCSPADLVRYISKRFFKAGYKQGLSDAYLERANG